MPPKTNMKILGILSDCLFGSTPLKQNAWSTIEDTEYEGAESQVGHASSKKKQKFYLSPPILRFSYFQTSNSTFNFLLATTLSYMDQR